jgi:hypothetical protein
MRHQPQAHGARVLQGGTAGVPEEGEGWGLWELFCFGIVCVGINVLLAASSWHPASLKRGTERVPEEGEGSGGFEVGLSSHFWVGTKLCFGIVCLGLGVP